MSTAPPASKAMRLDVYKRREQGEKFSDIAKIYKCKPDKISRIYWNIINNFKQLKQPPETKEELLEMNVRHLGITLSTRTIFILLNAVKHPPGRWGGDVLIKDILKLSPIDLRGKDKALSEIREFLSIYGLKLSNDPKIPETELVVCPWCKGAGKIHRRLIY